MRLCGAAPSLRAVARSASPAPSKLPAKGQNTIGRPFPAESHRIGFQAVEDQRIKPRPPELKQSVSERCRIHGIDQPGKRLESALECAARADPRNLN